MKNIKHKKLYDEVSILRKITGGILVLMLIMLTACSSSAPNTATTTPSSTSADSSTASNVIRVAVQSDGKTLDPHTATDAGSMHYIENMYSTLMQYNGKYGEIEPGLAESYTVSDDLLTYTFKLHQGVKFHGSGKELTSADVKYSIERIIDKGVRANQFTAVKSIEATDPYTVVFHLKQPMAPFLTYLANPMNGIVDSDIVKANNNSLDNVDAGTGPFELVKWDKDQQLTLKKNPDYYEKGLPYLDEVDFKPVADATARTTALRNNEIDLILETTEKENKVLENVEGITLKSEPGTFWEYIGLNVKDPALRDVRVRQAIANAVDRNQINQLVKLGKATVLDGGNIPPNHWAYPDIHPYAQRNVDKAKQLLQAAGSPAISLTLKVGSEYDYQVQAAQVIKQQLAEVGITVKVESQESSVFFDALGKGDFQMAVVGWQGFVDPDEYTYNLFHTGEAYNQQGYSNPEVDALLEKGRTTADEAARKDIYKQIETTVADEAPMVFLYMNERAAAYRNNVTGFIVEPTVTSIFLKQTKVQ